MTSHFVHEMPVHVYYEDTDAGGIVYHANYLKFAERGRTEYIRALGLTNTGVLKQFEIIFVVRSIQIDYLAPAFLEDELVVRTKTLDLKNASFTMHHEILKNGAVICAMTVGLVCVGPDKRPVRMPDDIRKLIQNKG